MVCLFSAHCNACFQWGFCVWNRWEIPPEQNRSGNGLTAVIRDTENICLIFEISIPSLSLYEIYKFLSLSTSLSQRKTFSYVRKIHNAFASFFSPRFPWWWWAVPSDGLGLCPLWGCWVCTEPAPCPLRTGRVGSSATMWGEKAASNAVKEPGERQNRMILVLVRCEAI